MRQGRPRQTLQRLVVAALLLVTTFAADMPQASATAAPVVEAGFTSAASLATNRLTLQKPDGVQAGDLLLVLVGNDNGSNKDQWNDANLKPAGFTLINESGDTINDCHAAAFYRVADGSEADSVDVPAKSTKDYWGYYVRVTGARTVDPVGSIGGDTNSVKTTSSITIPSIAVPESNSLAFYTHCFDGADAGDFSVTGDGWSESSEIFAGTLGRHASGSWGTSQQPDQGSTTSATVSVGRKNDGFSGFQFTITPASSPPQNLPPLADAGPDRTTSLADVTGFDATGSTDPDGVIVSYSWDLGDGTSATGATPSHVYASAGVYTAVLTVTDDGGATATDQVAVTVEEPQPPTDAADYYDVSYGPAVRNELDLFVPEGAGPFPTILYIHGGYWVSDNRDENPYGENYRNQGYAVATMDYRYANGTTTIYTQLLDDVEAAYDLIGSGAIDERIDPDKMVVSGFSAGAHLSALATLTNRISPAGVVTFGGPFELAATPRALQAAYDLGYDDAEIGSILQPILGCDWTNCTTGADVAASPTMQVDGSAYPPFFIQQGLADPINPPPTATFLGDELTANGVTNTVQLLPGFGHWIDLNSSVNQFLADVTGNQ